MCFLLFVPLRYDLRRLKATINPNKQILPFVRVLSHNVTFNIHVTSHRTCICILAGTVSFQKDTVCHHEFESIVVEHSIH